ncbi:MAG TPA: serine/threonine-protein kinase [Sandaracinaceae bacterium]
MARAPFDPATLPPGTIVAGKYELGPPIGHGQHSVVYSAVHRLLQRKAAVKVVAATDAIGQKRFAREARLAGSLEHPNVVEVYEVGRLDDGRPFLAMEYLEGETLEQRLRRRGTLDVAEAMELGQALLAGLAVAHEQRIVHRDLRPPNIFFAQVRGEEMLKILDFGISRYFGDASESTLTAPGTLVGGMHYLAPEQLYENGVIDHRTDLYATGVLLYQVLTGKLPFGGTGPELLVDIAEKTPDPPSRHRPGLPADVDRVVMTALAKRPDDRFQDAESMSEALRLAKIFASYMSGN